MKNMASLREKNKTLEADKVFLEKNLPRTDENFTQVRGKNMTRSK
jgi:hypothetical protein